MKSLAATALIICSLSHYALAKDAQHPTTISHPLQVGRHSSVSLAENTADTIIGGMASILGQCNSNAHRQGAVSVVSTPPTINSSSDMSAACGSSILEQDGGYEPLGAPRKVRVVNAINWCGTISAGIIGCAYTPGTCMVVVRFSPDQEAQLWAHEFGHSKGLPHRDDPDALMRPFIGASHRNLTKSECGRIRQLGFFAAGGEGVPLPTANVPITEFATRVFPHGVPYDEARQYSSADLDQIIPWLSQNERTAHWGNVVAIIGIVADSRSSQILRDFIMRSGSGILSNVDYQSRFSAIVHLGYVVNGSGDVAARRFLEDRAIPSAWAGLPWRASYHASDNERNSDLATAAALGLGLIGDGQAASALEQARISYERQLGGGSSQGYLAAVEEALRANARISDVGMRAYQRR